MVILQAFAAIVMLVFFAFYGLFSNTALKQIRGYYYKGPFNQVFYQSDFEGAKFYSKVEGVSGDKFQVIRCSEDANCYGRQDDKLYFHEHYLKHADPDSFKFIQEWSYAADKDSVFYMDDSRSKVLVGVDPKKFTHYINWYWKHNSDCYLRGEIVECPLIPNSPKEN